MLKERRAIKGNRADIGHALEHVFLYAELHCTLLMRMANNADVAMPEVPPISTEDSLINSFAAFVDEESLRELRSALWSASAVFDGLVCREDVHGGGGARQLLMTKRRLHRVRLWLARVANHGMVDSLVSPERSPQQSAAEQERRRKEPRKDQDADAPETHIR